jgi:uncharacterized integral membrane protein (TIGR00697 family)
MKKVSPLFLLLVVINTVTMLISNIIACKVFSIGFAVLPCAVIVFPITYILSDVFSEVYGYKWSRLTAWIAFGANLFMVGIFAIANVIPGVDSETSAAMQKVLGTTPWALAASLCAYMVGDLMNDKVFRKLKEKSGEKGFWYRAILSSLVGELCDSLIYIPLGMNLLPKLFLGFEFMTWKQVLIAIPTQAICKTLYETCIVPLTALVARKTKAYEIKNNADYCIPSEGVK